MNVDACDMESVARRCAYAVLCLHSHVVERAVGSLVVLRWRKVRQRQPGCGARLSFSDLS
jgi:hypothetical protein